MSDDLIISSTTDSAEDIQRALTHGLEPKDDGPILAEVDVDPDPAPDDADGNKATDEKKGAKAEGGDGSKDGDAGKTRKMDTSPRREDYQSDEEFKEAKTKHSMQKRIDTVTWQREEEKRKSDEQQRRIDDLERELQGLKAAGKSTVKVEEKIDAAKAGAEPGEPKAEDFETHEQWLAALSKFNTEVAVKKALEADRAERAREAAEQDAAEAHERFMESKAAVAQRYEDFDDVIRANKEMPISGPMKYILDSSAVGHDVAYYLATHRSEAKRIFEMSGPDQIREMGRLEERIERRVDAFNADAAADKDADQGGGDDGDVVITESGKAPVAPAKRVAQAVSKAPDPIAPVGARSTRSSQRLEDMSLEEFKAQRRQDEILRRKNRR